ncbi:enoyl-[acyl-carrier-protein] reductase, mitochondrial isoform X2 [Bombyx mori]|uniref:enoyl-[acyl-carrier-protein] reductase, mitochondrial isoform X2 n=1 Tax=Bombyx mori TaxID=7091 RepID=UPI002ED69121
MHPKEEPHRISFLTDSSPYNILNRITSDCESSPSASITFSSRMISLLSQQSDLYNSIRGSVQNQSRDLGGQETLLLNMVRARKVQDVEAQDKTLDLKDDLTDDQRNEGCIHGISMRTTDRSISRSRFSRVSTRRDMDIPSILAFTANTTQPVKNYCLPSLPSIPGDEGVGEVLEIGSHVCACEPGDRVVLTSRLLGTWRYYGVFHERDVHIISPNIPLPEASMLTIAPCMAYRMIKDFRNVQPGQTVIQNAANSPCGQCIVQLCKAWGINTFNIVANHYKYKVVKDYLLSIGATAVYTLEEAEELTNFNTSLSRPVLALNCIGARYENVILKLLERNGTVVYYGDAFNLPIVKQFLRCDVAFHKFHLCEWDAKATCVEKDIMLNDIIRLMVTGKFRAPVYVPVELKNYVHAFRNTGHCEAFSTVNYVFDFTLP